MTKIHLMGTNACHPKDFVYQLNGGQDWWLIIQTQTEAEFLIHDKFISYPENQIVIYPPFTKTTYRACSETYQDNWIRFYTDDPLITETTIPLGQPIQVSRSTVFHQLFQLLASETFLQNEYKSDSTNHLFHLLFHKIMEAYHEGTKQIQSQDLLDLHLDISGNPSYPWTVAAMAKRMHVSPGYLQSIYKKSFHISCMEDVIQNRISLAKDYLIHADYTVTQIASLCGYQNTEHFCRQFRKIVGVPPKQYRKSLSHNET